ncbi:unnamed protein product [Prunus brigantina]
MPGNDKPLATIIEGRWYFVGKSGRPTLELTRTQKRRVQRQYYTFLKNNNETQVLPETSSARKREKSRSRSSESPSKPSTHPASSSVNQLEPSQSQGQFRPILVKG